MKIMRAPLRTLRPDRILAGRRSSLETSQRDNELRKGNYGCVHVTGARSSGAQQWWAAAHPPMHRALVLTASAASQEPAAHRIESTSWRSAGSFGAPPTCIKGWPCAMDDACVMKRGSQASKEARGRPAAGAPASSGRSGQQHLRSPSSAVAAGYADTHGSARPLAGCCKAGSGAASLLVRSHARAPRRLAEGGGALAGGAGGGVGDGGGGADS